MNKYCKALLGIYFNFRKTPAVEFRKAFLNAAGLLGRRLKYMLTHSQYLDMKYNHYCYILSFWIYFLIVINYYCLHGPISSRSGTLHSAAATRRWLAHQFGWGRGNHAVCSLTKILHAPKSTTSQVFITRKYRLASVFTYRVFEILFYLRSS
jgi:hypothetical protein